MRHWVVLTVLATSTISPALRAAEPTPAPLPPQQAGKAMTLPPGFKSALFAGEPDVVQPIATAIDDRGRLWVAECLSYPKWTTDPKDFHDRIVIFEDQAADGHFSKKTVFANNIQNLSGLEIGFGGVWVCSSPNLLFIPLDANGDRPAGPPKVVLDGWDIKTAQHNVFNRLTWGPDGWLYGCNGIQSKSNVAKPGTPDDQRVAIDCGVWRYHPTRETFERVMEGTTNPWGLDYDDYGQMFITNCVIEHLFHVIPGGHYKRMHGQDSDPHAYGVMTTCADHIHWAGGAWTTSRGGEGAHSSAGGGHAHAGCMVYLGDNWPDEYRNNVFMCNIHGNRVNRDLLEQTGATYVAHHGADFMLANDSWFRGLNLIYGPDGGVYVNDWCDTGECHNHKVVDQTNGRIFKITYGDVAPKKVDLAALSDMELVKLQLHKDDWYVRHARRLLQERAAAHKLSADVIPALQKMYADQPDAPRKLRALWALYAVGGRAETRMALKSDEPYVKAWGVRLLVDGDTEPKVPEMSDLMSEAAASDSPVVRLAVVSALQRIPNDDRGAALNQLIWRAADAGEWNYVHMLWYACEPLAAEMNATELDGRVGTCAIPLLREYAARLLAERDPDQGVLALRLLLKNLTDGAEAANRKAAVADEVRGVYAALKDRKFDRPPAGWPDVAASLARQPEAEVRRLALLLSLAFADPAAQEPARAFVRDAAQPVPERQEMLQAIANARPADLADFLRALLSDKDVGETAIRSLAASGGGDATPRELLGRYAKFSHEGKRAAIATLASRPAWATALLDAVDAGTVPQADVGALTVRQLLSLKDKAVDAHVHKRWGNVRAASEDKVKLIAQYRADLAPDAMKKANLANGRAVFNRTCAQCHTLFGEGGKIGPDLTGSQRALLDYVLENVLDPSAVVAREYMVTVVKTKDGQVVSGIIGEETPTSLTLRMPGQNQTIQKADIVTRKTESISMMPEGLFQALTPDDRRDVVGYLASPAQVPLP